MTKPNNSGQSTTPSKRHFVPSRADCLALAQAETIHAKNAQSAVEQIRKLMLKHCLTTADIEANAKAKRDAKAGGPIAPSRGTKTTIATN